VGKLAAHRYRLISRPLPNWSEKKKILYKMAAKLKDKRTSHHHGSKHTYYDATFLTRLFSQWPLPVIKLPPMKYRVVEKYLHYWYCPFNLFFVFTGCIHGPEQGGRERRGGADLAGLQRGGRRKLSGTHEVCSSFPSVVFVSMRIQILQ
jgi:hypothetical protein